ncbi:MAG: propanediol utilization phosphotransacylase, partial [Paenibacillus sp.]|nr:propanediol utilization phosphotransacylase [Paenibacillus sp.]
MVLVKAYGSRHMLFLLRNVIIRVRKNIEKKVEVDIMKQVPIGVSARHIHLAEQHIEQLFGEGYQLKVLKELSQPGQFAAVETVAVAGPKGRFDKVRILGPARGKTQLEVARTDAFLLGI